VKREGTWGRVPAKDLVRRDIVRIKAGDMVPADLRILLVRRPLDVDQSSLTGESLPVQRGEGETVYSGLLLKVAKSSLLVRK